MWFREKRVAPFWYYLIFDKSHWRNINWPRKIFLLSYSNATNLEKRITSALKLLKIEEVIDNATYKNIKLVGSRPGILCGLGKIRKENKKGLPPLRPTLSAVGTPTYKLSKFLQSFLTPLTKNEHTVTVILLKKFINKALTYIWLIFTNITQDETNDISIDNLYDVNKNTPKTPL